MSVLSLLAVSDSSKLSNMSSLGTSRKLILKPLLQAIGSQDKWHRRCAVLTEEVLAFSAFHGPQDFPEESRVSLESCMYVLNS